MDSQHSPSSRHLQPQISASAPEDRTDSNLNYSVAQPTLVPGPSTVTNDSFLFSPKSIEPDQYSGPPAPDDLIPIQETELLDLSQRCPIISPPEPDPTLLSLVASHVNSEGSITESGPSSASSTGEGTDDVALAQAEYNTPFTAPDGVYSPFLPEFGGGSTVEHDIESGRFSPGQKEYILPSFITRGLEKKSRPVLPFACDVKLCTASYERAINLERHRTVCHTSAFCRKRFGPLD